MTLKLFHDKRTLDDDKEIGKFMDEKFPMYVILIYCYIVERVVQESLVKLWMQPNFYVSCMYWK